MRRLCKNFVMLAAIAAALATISSATPAQAQDGTCKRVTVTYSVSAWGADALFQHSDLVAGLVDGSGNPNGNGRYLKVTRGSGERQPEPESFQPAGGLLDAIASGQTLTVPVNPSNGQISVLFNLCWQ
jgi:hypothetical protein